MSEKPHPPLPEPIKQLQEQLEEFRLTHARRSKLPEALWHAAATLARQHGLYLIAHTLRLDYAGLKKRLAGSSRTEPKSDHRATAKTAFLELSTPTLPFAEYVIEFESVGGGKMRIQWKASTEPDWTKLLRAWRESEG